MEPVKELERHYLAGSYLCPDTGREMRLEMDVPRAWVEWPVEVECAACGQVHLLHYEDVREPRPAFGYE
jgi:hypothetical protein